MHRIDQLPLESPFAGARLLWNLWHQGRLFGGPKASEHPDAVHGMEALYRWPRTPPRPSTHKRPPDLLGDDVVGLGANQVWAMGINDIPIDKGLVYLVAMVDFATRRMLTGRLAITKDVQLCLYAGEDALSRYGKPAIRNTDQGS